MSIKPLIVLKAREASISGVIIEYMKSLGMESRRALIMSL